MNSLVSKSIFGQIDRDAETINGRNVGQMQDEMSEYVEQIVSRIPMALEQMSVLDAHVAIRQAFEQGISRMWNGNSLDVYVIRNGHKAIQAVNANDIAEMLQSECGEI